MSSLVTLFGLKNAGKKTFLANIIEKDFSMLSETFRHVLRELELTVQVFDLDPNSPMDSWSQSIQNGEIRLVIYMVDGSDQTAFNLAKQEFLKLLEHIKKNIQPLLILINKIDLDFTPDLTVQIIQDFKLLELVDRKWLVHKISNKTGEGLKEGFQWIYEVLTGNKVPSTLVIDDMLIFSFTGDLIAESGKGKIEDPYLHSGLLAALEIVSQKTLDGKMDALTLGDKKFVFGREKDLIGVLVTNRDADNTFAKKIIKRVLKEIHNNEEDKIQEALTLILKDLKVISNQNEGD
ncbi:MAG: ADP-ribosylation factor-like protein [Candidatus Hodarchaeota archaeon]